MKQTLDAVEIEDGDIQDANASPLLADREGGPNFASANSLVGVKAIYFDLDDTLCGYWDASKFALRKVFAEHAPEGFTAEEMVRNWAGAFREFSPTLKKTGWYEGYLKSGVPTRTEQMRLTLKRINRFDEDLAQLLSERYGYERNQALTLFEDAEEVLTKVKAQFPLGLVTNGPADIQRQEIARLGVEHYFTNIYIEGEMGEGKPNQSVFQRAAAAVGFGPSEILFVGNSYGHDIAPAIEAGWKTAWIRRPSDIPPSAGPEAMKPEEMPDNGKAPDATLNDLRSLLPLLAL